MKGALLQGQSDGFPREAAAGFELIWDISHPPYKLGFNLNVEGVEVGIAGVEVDVDDGAAALDVVGAAVVLGITGTTVVLVVAGVEDRRSLQASVTDVKLSSQSSPSCLSGGKLTIREDGTRRSGEGWRCELGMVMQVAQGRCGHIYPVVAILSQWRRIDNRGQRDKEAQGTSLWQGVVVGVQGVREQLALGRATRRFLEGFTHHQLVVFSLAVVSAQLPLRCRPCYAYMSRRMPYYTLIHQVTSEVDRHRPCSTNLIVLISLPAAACVAGRLDGFGSSRTGSAIFGSTQGVLGSLRLGFVERIQSVPHGGHVALLVHDWLLLMCHLRLWGYILRTESHIISVLRLMRQVTDCLLSPDLSILTAVRSVAPDELHISPTMSFVAPSSASSITSVPSTEPLHRHSGRFCDKTFVFNHDARRHERDNLQRHAKTCKAVVKSPTKSTRVQSPSPQCISVHLAEPRFQDVNKPLYQRPSRPRIVAGSGAVNGNCFVEAEHTFRTSAIHRPVASGGLREEDLRRSRLFYERSRRPILIGRKFPVTLDRDRSVVLSTPPRGDDGDGREEVRGSIIPSA
ncbi:hypothetical protein PR048_027641 [Dryococelus australis]|uniref:Uncharacterized protein n=1 Tax=Dryococelus australis TaxID=614101 RepID=A0ABQ9GH26_9NEOP|nr:hypothetical protein PR048_027641 [Dryococelus australis]